MKKLHICRYLLLVCLIAFGLIAQAAAIGDTLGISHHFSFNEQEDGKSIALIADLGFKTVRTDFTWAAVEQQQGSYQFAAYDKLVEELAARDLRPLFILNYGNTLYEKEYFAVRTAVGRHAYANFAAAAAEHYKGKNVIWELWNEPNIGTFWKPSPNPEEYAAMAAEAAAAIRSVDPSATIIGPAPLGIDLDFLETCFKHGLLTYLDAVSIHPYRKDPPNHELLSEYRDLQSLIEKYRPPQRKVNIIVSEWGYSTARVTTKDQADYAARMFLLNAASGIPLSIWYDFKNDGLDAKNAEHNFGLLTGDGSPKNAYYRLHLLAMTLQDMQFLEQLPAKSNDYLLLFANREKSAKILAGWSDNPKEHTVFLPNGRQMLLTATPKYLDYK